MKILAIDIETRPNLAYVWGLWDQNVGLSQLVDEGEMICFAAKWIGEPEIFFFSTYHHGYERMVTEAHRLLGEADAIVHFNGNRFDIPHLNTCFLKLGLTPPAPAKQIDLLVAVKKRFRFVSNKLEHVSKTLGLKGKVQTGGFELWIGCMNDDPKAWKKMRRYNIQDVVLLEELLDILLPWIPGLPHVGLYEENPEAYVCPACGSDNLVKEGYAYTSLSRFQRYHCADCGKWSRDGRRNAGVDLRGEAS